MMRYFAPLIVFTGGLILLVLGMVESTLPSFVQLYMITFGSIFVCGAIGMWWFTRKDYL